MTTERAHRPGRAAPFRLPPRKKRGPHDGPPAFGPTPIPPLRRFRRRQSFQVLRPRRLFRGDGGGDGGDPANRGCLRLCSLHCGRFPRAEPRTASFRQGYRRQVQRRYDCRHCMRTKRRPHPEARRPTARPGGRRAGLFPLFPRGNSISKSWKLCAVLPHP